MNKQLTPAGEIKRSLDLMRDQFKAALPSHIPVERFVRTLQTALLSNNQLASADRNSVYSAAMKCAQDGLLPDNREAAILIFKDKNGRHMASYIPMVSGILKKIRNSGELLSITSQIVHKNDKFRYWIDADGEHIEHEPNMFAERGEVVGVYALAKTKDGGVYIDVMTNEEIQAVRKASRSNSGPWAGPFANEMAKKAVIKRLSKRLPMSTDLEGTIRADDDIIKFDDEPQTVEPVEEKEVAPKNKPSRLESAMDEAPLPEDVYVEKMKEAKTKKVVNHATGEEKEVPI